MAIGPPADREQFPTLRPGGTYFSARSRRTASAGQRRVSSPPLPPIDGIHAAVDAGLSIRRLAEPPNDDADRGAGLPIWLVARCTWQSR